MKRHVIWQRLKSAYKDQRGISQVFLLSLATSASMIAFLVILTFPYFKKFQYKWLLNSSAKEVVQVFRTYQIEAMMYQKAYRLQLETNTVQVSYQDIENDEWVLVYPVFKLKEGVVFVEEDSRDHIIVFDELGEPYREYLDVDPSQSLKTPLTEYYEWVIQSEDLQKRWIKMAPVTGKSQIYQEKSE
ncbi:MAG: hypothetical protein CL521_04090 [Actinobacteria bacterium]|nr:hypothetical protein [Actinomycetota bacterium]|tara:strand:- start:251 stop:811 length:561 start_codon:yes stop_codon:yes gene_type:complete